MQMMDEAQTEADTVRQWVRDMVQAENTNPSQFAVSRGIEASTITRFLGNKTKSLNSQTLRSLAANAPVQPPPEVQRSLDVSPKNAREQGVNIWTEFGNVPIWSAIPLQRNGEFYLNPQSVAGTINHTVVATKIRKLAAFYAPDDTMTPRWSTGEPVLYDLAKPTSEGDYGLIRLHHPSDPNGHDTYLLRKIGREARGNLEVFRLNALDTPEYIPVERVQFIWHVLNWSDLVG